ncbi:unnamed protein product [Rotaria sp. Silwood2]|nr:unnamed protein product [Rotaria sp. Silwood2]CAF2919561.1 unnamed protein product [Rotaria sp. Silwood2]CAF3327974.1 unnamed protein product [Rotaria sp. Silwood2]CAF3962961.1 unnamed protein product [Rotaria sp. Silwood2]CAF4092968.1 unnamed protein product [Rotaria sp. Silwood2]
MMYRAIVDNLKKYLLQKNKFLKDLRVLDPAARTEFDATDQMVRVGRALPNLLSDSEIDRIRHVFMMYATKTIDKSWHIKSKCHDPDGNTQIEYHHIDHYWNKMLSLTTNAGLPKYPILAKIVKNVLIVSHGNSDV